MHEAQRLPMDELQQMTGVDRTLKHIVEALIFASSDPISVESIQDIFQGLGEDGKPRRVESMEIATAVEELNREYDQQGTAYRILKVAGGFQFATLPQYAEWVGRLYEEKARRKLSQAALETLAIIAYKQPVTRAEVEDLRGVDIASVLAALLEKNLIKIVGRKEVPGRPFLYGTTEKFLEHFGLKALSDLPQVGEIRELVEKALPREKFLNPKQEESQPKTESTENPDVQASESPDTVPGPVETSPEDRPA